MPDRKRSPAARSRSEIDYNEGGLAEKQKVGFGSCDNTLHCRLGLSQILFPRPGTKRAKVQAT